jgi:hypothetical protein
VDPRGWLWHSFGYLDKFVAEVLLQALDVRDLMETDRLSLEGELNASSVLDTLLTVLCACLSRDASQVHDRAHRRQ